MEYLWALFSIFLINILLSGDNALVIALASRNLPEKHKRTAVLFGSIGAIGLRIILTFLTVYLLQMAYLQLIGGLLLLGIAIKLVADDHEIQDEVEAKSNLWGAIRTIIVADLVMSLDNVVAIAGAAKGNISLIVVGLLISIPLIIWGSQLISSLMQRWPIIVLLGAALLGWTAGEMVIAEKTILFFLNQYPLLSWLIPVAFTGLVVLTGVLLKRKIRKADATD